MRYRVHLSRLPSGGFVATCLDPQCTGRGETPEEAAENVRHEIRYRIELCPCTGVEDESVEVELIGEKP